MSNRKKIPEIIILKVLKRQTLKCNICFKKLETTNDGVKLFDIDHIEMFSLSGNNDYTNLQALCLPCHRIKTTHEIRHIIRKKIKKKTSNNKKIKICNNVFFKFAYKN